MIRLLYVTDPHVRGNSPKARTDDFPLAIHAKFRECWSLAQQHHCQAVIFGGDILDSPDPDYSVTGTLAAILRECPVPIYTVAGNHEIFGYNLSTVPRTALGLLARIGAVKLLSREPVVIEDATTTVKITGQGFHADTDRSQADYQTGNDPDYQTGLGQHCGGWKVHVVHSMLLEKPLPNECAHILIKDLETDADLILASHFHAGFVSQRCLSGALCVNPGALGRVRADIAEIYRPVQVALLEFVSDAPIRVEMIPLECARPGIEVLSREHIEREIEREDRTAAFLSLLTEEGESRFLSTREIVEDIASRDALPMPVIQDALRRIGEAREQLGRGA